MNYDPWTYTLPVSLYVGQRYNTFDTIVIRIGPDRTYGNEPFDRMIDEFKRLTETVLEQKRRISRERNRLHIRRARMFAPPPLVEAMFDKPTFVRRACGGRWRVMAP